MASKGKDITNVESASIERACSTLLADANIFRLTDCSESCRALGSSESCKPDVAEVVLEVVGDVVRIVEEVAGRSAEIEASGLEYRGLEEEAGTGQETEETDSVSVGDKMVAVT